LDDDDGEYADHSMNSEPGTPVIQIDDEDVDPRFQFPNNESFDD